MTIGPMDEFDYVHRWQLQGGTLHRFDLVKDFDAYLSIPGWFDFQNIYDLAVAEARPGGILVEIGSYMGRSTAYLASRVAKAQKPVSIYAVDPWLGWPQGEPDTVFPIFLHNMLNVGVLDLLVPLRMMSAQASRLFDDSTVDFCFLDGDHTYQAVREDLRCWYPKLRTGAFFGGHDYVGEETPGVKQAVDEFFASPVHVEGTSWLTRKIQ